MEAETRFHVTSGRPGMLVVLYIKLCLLVQARLPEPVSLPPADRPAEEGDQADADPEADPFGLDALIDPKPQRCVPRILLFVAKGDGPQGACSNEFLPPAGNLTRPRAPAGAAGRSWA